MKISKILKNTLYSILFFIFLISGMIGISDILEKIKITGTFNFLLMFILTILFFAFLSDDLKKLDNRKELLDISKNVFQLHLK